MQFLCFLLITRPWPSCVLFFVPIMVPVSFLIPVTFPFLVLDIIQSKMVPDQSWSWSQSRYTSVPALGFSSGPAQHFWFSHSTETVPTMPHIEQTNAHRTLTCSCSSLTLAPDMPNSPSSMTRISSESMVPPPSLSNTLNTHFSLSSGDFREVALMASMYSSKSSAPLLSSSKTLRLSKNAQIQMTWKYCLQEILPDRPMPSARAPQT